MADKNRLRDCDSSKPLDYGRREDPGGLWGEQDKVEIEFETLTDEEFLNVVARAEEAAAKEDR